MSLLKKIFSRKPATPRIRICVECGVEVPEHKDWCAIYRHLQEQSQQNSAD